MGQIVFATNGTPVMTTSKQFDHLNRLQNISSSSSSSFSSSFSYQYNSANQRVRVNLRRAVPGQRRLVRQHWTVHRNERTAWEPVQWSVRERGNLVEISTAKVTVRVAQRTGAVTFLDAKGNIMVREKEGGGKVRGIEKLFLV